jgi:hypothetical protein
MRRLVTRRRLSGPVWRRRRKRTVAVGGIDLVMLTEEQIADNARRRSAEAAARRGELANATEVRLRVHRVLDLAAPLVSVATGSEGELILVTSDADLTRTYAGRNEQGGWASFAHSTSTERYAVTVVVLGQTENRSVVVPELTVAYPMFQPLPGGRILVVGGRSHVRETGAEHNACVLAPDGKVESTFTVGDGVQDVQVSSSGKIWVAYHDEGVFGNNGWGAPHGPEPLGAPGLVCWNDDGTKMWDFIPPDSVGSIDDCYAMNVIGETAWANYYSNFPIVRVAPGSSVDSWTCGVAGAHALVVAEDKVGLLGGYSGLHDRLVVGSLSGGEFQDRVVNRIVMPDGSPLREDALVMGRGALIHVVSDSRWFVLDMTSSP